MVEEYPLHARVVVLHERLHEQPLALDIEAKEAMRDGVPREPVRPEVDEPRGRDHGAAQVSDVEEEIRVAPGAMREMRQEASAVAHGEIAHDEHAPGARSRDGDRRALYRCDEVRCAEVAVIVSETGEPEAGRRQRGCIRERATVGKADGAVLSGNERRGGPHARREREGDRARREYAPQARAASRTRHHGAFGRKRTTRASIVFTASGVE